jgi:hypothetical protein
MNLSQLPQIVSHLDVTQLRIGFEILVALFCSLATFTAGFFLKRAKAFFSGMDAKLDTIQSNHLTHIELHTAKSVELLEKILGGQNEANLKAAELNAWLKAKME